MTVYVDDMRARYGRMIMCHMVADTLEELHDMADKIGIKRKWFQGDHYDICLAKRRNAVALGAKEITRREALRICRPELYASIRAQVRGERWNGF